MDAIRKWDRDDSGMSSLQVVMILAIAVIVLALIKAMWWDIKNWLTIALFWVVDFEGTQQGS